MALSATSDTPVPPSRSRELWGHPKGLFILFATEMWERFSFYGMSALLLLYMVKYLFTPGHVETVIGFAAMKGAIEAIVGPRDMQPLASQIVGFYTGLVYLTPVLGGFVADRLLGQRNTAIVGALFMAAGHFMMAFQSLFFFALLMLILGNGAFKPNISTQVGALYAEADGRRDRAYSIFYIGINIGAFLAPLVCGTLADAFGWDFGFGAAGVGMVICLAVYISGQRVLPPDQLHRARAAHLSPHALAREERRAVAGLITLFMFVLFFWAVYDQQSNTLILWTEYFTDRSIDLGFWKGEIPTPWFLALNPMMIFLFTPLIVRLWAVQARLHSEPFTVTKMALGCLGLVAGNLLMAAAASTMGPGGKASPLWLIAYFIVVTVGELYFAPIGLALVSRMAPAKMLSMLMGLWLATTFPGDLLGGWLAGFWSSMPKEHFFLMMAGVAAFAAVGFTALSPLLRSLFDFGQAEAVLAQSDAPTS
jgi:proton-dependent oligopeptide transporter, POT family